MLTETNRSAAIRWNRAETSLVSNTNMVAKSRRTTERVTSKCGRVDIKSIDAFNGFAIWIDGERARGRVTLNGHSYGVEFVSGIRIAKTLATLIAA